MHKHKTSNNESLKKKIQYKKGVAFHFTDLCILPARSLFWMNDKIKEIKYQRYS